MLFFPIVTAGLPAAARLSDAEKLRFILVIFELKYHLRIGKRVGHARTRNCCITAAQMTRRRWQRRWRRKTNFPVGWQQTKRISRRQIRPSQGNRHSARFLAFPTSRRGNWNGKPSNEILTLNGIINKVQNGEGIVCPAPKSSHFCLGIQLDPNWDVVFASAESPRASRAWERKGCCLRSSKSSNGKYWWTNIQGNKRKLILKKKLFPWENVTVFEILDIRFNTERETDRYENYIQFGRVWVTDSELSFLSPHFAALSPKLDRSKLSETRLC